MGQSPTINWKLLSESAGGYSPAAFDFVREGLQHTVERVHGEIDLADFDPDDETRHVAGSDLCLGLRDLAIQRYGMLARTVLGRWNIRETADFGRIVFAMIEAGLLRKTDEDSFDDFVGVYDFEEAFAPAETV